MRWYDNRIRSRLRLLSIVAVVVFLALGARLWSLQVLAAERYGKLAEVNRVRQVVVKAPRGRILDRNGKELVRNRAAWAITVKPADLTGRQRDTVLRRLSDLVDVPTTEIDRRLRDNHGSPLQAVPVAEDVPAEALYYLAEHAGEFPGVVPEVVALREYPYGKAAAHVLGYVAEIAPDELTESRFRGYEQGDVIGKAGVELTYDRWLRGVDGVADFEVNASGRVVRSLGGREPKPGMDLRLSIDMDVQRQAERSLEEGMRLARSLPDSERGGTYPAPAATAVVLDPRDGSVLALASLPQYDPRKFAGGISGEDFARYARDPVNPLLNRAIQSAYPPGSTWKPVTALAALDAGVITPGTTFNDPGYFRFGGRVFHGLPPGGLGLVDLPTSLVKSSDVYYYNVAARLAARETAQEARGQKAGELLQATARRLGFGSKPGIDLPFAVSGTVPTRQWRKQFWEANKDVYCQGTSALQRYLCHDGARWQPGDLVNLSIGQGDLLVSPLQLAAAYGALANGGTVRAPHVGAALLAPGGGRVVRELAPGRAERARVRPAFLRMVKDALAGVPRQGTAQAAFAGFPLDRVPVAGKTGTAEVNNKAPFSWFASFAPAAQPRYVVVVMVEQGGFGGQTAAPVARSIYEHLFGLEGRPIQAGSDATR